MLTQIQTVKLILNLLDNYININETLDVNDYTNAYIQGLKDSKQLIEKGVIK